MVHRLLGRLGAGPIGPIRLALFLAIPTLPVITWAIANPYRPAEYVGGLIPLGDALKIAIGALAAAALAGGFVGGRLAGRQTLSVLAAIAVAWFVGIASLSVVPALMGIEYRGTALCIFGCTAIVDAANPASGAITWAMAAGMTTTSFVAPVIAAVLLIAANRTARGGERIGASILIVVAHGIAHGMVFVGGGLPAIAAYLCLGAGVIAWSTVVVRVPQPAPVAPEPAALREALSV